MRTQYILFKIVKKMIIQKQEQHLITKKLPISKINSCFQIERIDRPSIKKNILIKVVFLSGVVN